jgi:hypothetical protein
MFDINNLAPAAKDALLQSLLDAAGGESPSMPGASYNAHPDEAMDNQPTSDEVKQYMEACANGMETLANIVQSLQSQIDDLVSGLVGVLDARTRYSIEQESISKYGEMFKPYVGFAKEYDGSDLMQELVDAIAELRGQPDYSEDKEAQYIQQAQQQLKEKMDRIRGVITPAEADASEESPAADMTAKPGATTEATIEPDIVVEKTVKATEPDLASIKRTAERLKNARVTNV